METFPNLEAAWKASPEALRKAGLDRRTIANLLEARRTLDLQALQHKLDTLGAAALTLDDPDYPAVLKELPDAPPVLYIKGSLATSDNWGIAIVGTRKATAYGRDMAYTLGRQLAQNGITVISGLATGIDAAAHRGALDGGGRTLAVLPCGIDSIYPPEHHQLASQIATSGALVTELPLGVQAEAKNFAPRNRIISGLSLGVIVVEAPARSGALLTADSAAEQGRDVFAVPGPPSSPVSHGTNRLIQDGAKLIMSIEDVLEELNLTRDTPQIRAEVTQIAPETPLEQQVVAALLEAAPLHVDELCRLCEVPASEMSAALMIMELKGLVRQAGGMQYALAGSTTAPFLFD
ncbi:MAG: DNA-processing protein DprA [Anaerolineae bacterium]|nr:DNA-processing protein DprA [Anaerolineae bacterium]